MRSAHIAILVLHLQLCTPFILKQYDFIGVIPEMKAFANIYNHVLREAGKDLNWTHFEPETNMTTVEMIKHLGYPAEVHQVTTKDGYILEMHRIPNNEVPRGNKKLPVLLQHGLLASSADWVLNLKNESLGYMLSDAGYDVWLGNIRGNTYCHKHVNMTSKDPKFWKFSWDEMGEFDVPAMIDYILATTGHDQLYYVGHSMGTTMAFAMLATQPPYNDKIKTMFALAPIAILNHVKTEIVKLSAPYYKEIMFALRSLRINEFLPNNAILKYLVKKLCHVPHIEVCTDIMFATYGRDMKQLNVTRLPIYLTHTPAGTSPQTLAHFAQVIDDHQWQHYDWGFFTNILKYGSIHPPKYIIENIKTPVVLFYGLNDPLAVPEDVEFFSTKLQNLVGKFQIEDKDWNHVDFVWGIDAGKLVNTRLIGMLNNETQNI